MCDHYKRECMLVCPTCKLSYDCRFCHDKDWEFAHENDHTLPRFEVKEIICRKCFLQQEVSNRCKKCSVQFGEYFCNKCNLWASNEVPKYHCDGCGFCHQGKREDFYHCEKCNGCFSVRGKEEHKLHCRENLFDTDCPICFQNLKTSTKASMVIRCGHMIHQDCLHEYAKRKPTCPVCRKLIIAPDSHQVKTHTAMVDALIAANPIPEEEKTKVTIACNECNKTFSEMDFHPMGIKCPDCNCYNNSLQ